MKTYAFLKMIFVLPFGHFVQIYYCMKLLNKLSSGTLLCEQHTSLQDMSPRDQFNCVKCVQIRSFFWSVFSRIQTEYGEILRSFFWSVFSPIRTEYGEILVFGHFSRSVQIWHPLHFQRTKKAAFNWSHDTVKRGLISWSSHSQKLV